MRTTQVAYRSARTAALACALLAATGCAPGGQSGEETAACVPVSSTPLERDEASSLGFSPADVLVFAEGSHAETFTYEGGATTPLTVDVAVTDGTFALVHYEYQDDGSGAELALGCADQVEADATVGFVTDDGAFDESWAVTLGAPDATAMTAYHDVDLDALGGTFDIASVVDEPSQYDDITAWANLTFDADGVSGELTAQGSRVDDTGPDGTASATNLPIGSY